MININERIENIRKKYALPEEKNNIKKHDFLILIIGVFIKEIIECFLNTVKPSWKGLDDLFNLYPFSDKVFWFLILKFILGLLILIYFIFKYSESFSIWYVTIFWLFTTGNSITSVFSTLGDFWRVLSGLVSMGNLFLCVLFLFKIDKSNLDSLKLLFYDDLIWDDFKKRYIVSPYSKISGKKIEHLIWTTLCIVLGAMWTYGIVLISINKIFNLKEQDQITENQQTLEEAAKKQFLTILFSSIVLAPLIEELVFRRCFMKIGGMNKLTVFLSAFIFGLIHLKGETFLKIPPYFIPGLYFSSAFFITRNLWHTIFAHALFNLIAFATTIGFR